MIQKIYEIVEGTIALVALIAVVGVSTFSVLALNPNVTTDVPNQEVAGAFTTANSPSNSSSLLINNLGANDKNYSSQLLSLGYNKGYEYTADFKTGKDSTKKSFVEIYNSNEKNVQLNFEVEILGAVQDSIKIKVSDTLDTLVLYSPEIGVNKVKLTIPANSKRTLDINYEFLQNINFGFQVKIKLD